jgi:uncharacterized membrane protein HdeD (DUF308 family)
MPSDAIELCATLASRWWVLVLRGALAMLFGVAMLVWPDVSFQVLLVFTGAWFVADGAMTLAVAFGYGRKALQLSDGAVGVTIGLVAMLSPGVDGIVLLVIVAIWAIARGILQILLAVDLASAHRWGFAAIGALSVVFAAVLLTNTSSGALAALPLIAGFAVLLGVCYAAVGFWIERSNVSPSLPYELPPRRPPRTGAAPSVEPAGPGARRELAHRR